MIVASLYKFLGINALQKGICLHPNKQINQPLSFLTRRLMTLSWLSPTPSQSFCLTALHKLIKIDISIHDFEWRNQNFLYQFHKNEI